MGIGKHLGVVRGLAPEGIFNLKCSQEWLPEDLMEGTARSTPHEEVLTEQNPPLSGIDHNPWRVRVLPVQIISLRFLSFRINRDKVSGVVPIAAAMSFFEKDNVTVF